jgi:hypothetical protein
MFIGKKTRKSTDQRKPFGNAIARLSFPSKVSTPPTTPREQSGGQKGREWLSIYPIVFQCLEKWRWLAPVLNLEEDHVWNRRICG